MTRITDEAVAEIAGRMFDGDLVRQPQRVQDRIWRDARAALEAALPHLEGATPAAEITDEDIRIAAEQAAEWRAGLSEGATPAIDREAIRREVAEEIAVAIEHHRDPDGFDIAVNLDATITQLARITREIGGTS